MSRPGLQLYTHEFHPKKGGIASYCHEFAQAAASMGYEVSVHGPRDADAVSQTDCTYALIPGSAAGNHNPPAIWHSRRLLQRTLATFSKDLHLFAEPGPLLALGTLPQELIAQSQTILTLHGSEINRWRQLGWQSPLARRALHNAHGICTVSQPIRELTVRAFPELAGKTKAVPNALPAQFAARGADFQRSAPKPDANFNILSVGRIHPRKGYDHVIQAIGRLPGGLKQRIHYTVAGGRKSEDYLQQLQQLALREQVQFNTHLDLNDAELDRCYRGADLFALTSLPHKNSIEGFGLVYLEAGAYALPCIGYDSGGVSDAIRDGETGILVPAGELSALAAAIQRLLEDPQVRASMGHNNQVFCQRRSWTDVVRETLELAK